MKILYSASMQHGLSSASFRSRALQRLGHQITTVDTDAYIPQNRILSKVLFRVPVGRHIDRYNQDIRGLANKLRPHVFWTDKDLAIRPDTLSYLHKLGVITVGYVSDNPFGPRNDPGWLLYRRSLPFFDAHVVPRQISVEDYVYHGAKYVIKTQFSYEPTVHFPRRDASEAASYERPVSFIGSPYDNRARVLSELCRRGIALSISGNKRAWRRVLDRATFDTIFTGGELIGDEYRRGICNSRINLSFVTHSNLDEVAHKSFEITACGGFLLAERTAEHLRCFREDVEAVFFSGIDELETKARKYLADQEAREQIARAGQRRSETSGYSNDSQLRLVVEALYNTYQTLNVDVDT